jgi:predicted  nucleic acid-binding Zn-ribbon protein
MFHFIMYPDSDVADAANCIEELQKRLAKAENRLNSLEKELSKLYDDRQAYGGETR